MIGRDQLKRSERYVFAQGRLLERQLYVHFFQKGRVEACLRALLAYQNPDGGFGNGLEPDLLCPDSTMIGAESAFHVLDLLDEPAEEIVEGVISWIKAHLNEQGTIAHPPPGLYDYPHQPWWENPDGERILRLVATLQKWGKGNPTLLARIRAYYETIEPPEQIEYYGYPHYFYLKHCGKSDRDRARLADWRAKLPAFLDRERVHYPLFSRAWYDAAEDVDRQVLQREAHRFVDGLQEDGGLDAPYPELPWWRPIWTVEGLIQLKRLGMM